MKMRIPILRLLNPILFALFIYNCSEDPLVSNLDHSGLTINTLTIDNISAQNYSVAPNLGTNESLYLGTKNGLNIPVSFIEIANNAYWSYGFDSTILIDSLHFITYSKDSLLLQNSTPNLFFSPDSQFDENTSTYLDFSTFSNLDWVDLDQPMLKTNNDTSGNYLYTELIWGIDTLMESLIDTSDSNLVRSFALQFTNNDSNYIESVSMIDNNRHTVCLSSQIGCSVDCDFCATGKMGIIRNLDCGEIIQQLIIISNERETPITNIVFMGMGEPFLNYKNVIKSCKIMNDSKGFNLSSKKITISTSGILPKIEKFISEKHKYKLAISLNASNNITRDKLIPINKKWPIENILTAIKKYNYKKYSQFVLMFFTDKLFNFR